MTSLPQTIDATCILLAARRYQYHKRTISDKRSWETMMIGAVTDGLSQLYGGVFLCSKVAFMVQPHLTQHRRLGRNIHRRHFRSSPLKFSPHSVILVKYVPRYTCKSNELVYRFLNEVC
jgi:hypothetical protein